MVINGREDDVVRVDVVGDVAVPKDRLFVEAEGPYTRRNEYLPNLRGSPYLYLDR